MSTVFDVYAIVLLITSLAIFVNRYIRSEPPFLPYLVIACTCGAGNLVGEEINPFAGLAMLTAASFLFLSCLLYPHVRNMGQKPDDVEFETTN
ncbi:MAG: XrtV sorting system accessory protein [Pseudomonadota bacterium]